MKIPEKNICVVAALKKDWKKEKIWKIQPSFSRTNQEAEGLVGALMEYQVPFTMKEQTLFRHWICRNLQAYLQMAAGQQEELSEMMNRPNRYISRDALPLNQISFVRLGILQR